MSQQEVKRIQLPKGLGTEVVEGFIGGESHDSYVLEIQAGRTLSLRLGIDEKEKEDGSEASFSVSLEEFGEGVDFGSESDGGLYWEGKVTATSDYFISVVAHPSAHYKLTVTAK
jgi:hypothetical protein